MPLRFAVVREGVEPKTITTKLQRIPVTIPPDDGNVPFTHVEDDLTFPMPPGGEIDSYVVYVGFDPQAAQELDRKKPAPNRRGRAAQLTAYPSSRLSGLNCEPLPAAQRDHGALERPHVRDHGAGAGAGELGAEARVGVAAADEADRHHAGGSGPPQPRPANPPPRCNRPAATRILAATWRNRSGAGLPRGTSLAENR